MTDNSADYLTTLHKRINKHFNLDEIRTLCFELSVDYESVPGEEKPSRIRELILALGRHGRLPDLIILLQQKRPRVDWPPVPDDFQPPESLDVGGTAVPANQYDVDVKGSMIGTAVGDGVSVTANNIVGGDMVGGDKVGGDKITVGDVSGGSVVAAGREAMAVGPRGVYVGGSVYGNIHTGDVINYYIIGVQTFFPQFTVGIQSFLTNYLGTDEKPVPFGGRDRQLKQLNDWLTRGATQRLLLVAPAGRGKSALLARWSQQLTAVDNLDVVFMPVSLRFNTNREDNTFVILATRLAHFYGKQIPTGYANQSPQFWRELVAEYLREPLPDGRQLLLILDGLDEAAWDVAADILPLNIPTTTRVVASARYLGGEEQSPEPWLRRLGWDGLPEVETIELNKLTRDGVQDVLQKMGCPLEELGQNVDIVAELYHLSDGDPLLLELYVKDLWEKQETAVRLKPEDLRNIEPGYKGYFGRWWEDQEKLWGENTPMEKPLVNDVLDMLAMALGSLLISDLRQLLPEQVHSRALKRAIRPLNRFVIGDGKEQGYVFSHPKLGEYFRDELEEDERADWQARFLAWGKRTLADLQAERVKPDDVPRYLLLYYGRHLEIANATVEEMLPLISQEWMQVWLEQTRTHEGFLEDVDKVLKKVQKVNETAVNQGRKAPYLNHEIACLLCHTSITSLSRDLPPHLPALLVRDNLWTPQQVVSHTSRIPDVAQRARTFVTLLTVEESETVFSLPENQDLRGVIISSALRDMRLLWSRNKVNEAELFQLQLDVSPFLSVHHVNDALSLADRVQRSIWRARLLTELVPLIEEQRQQIQTIKKIIHACSEINDGLCSEDISFIVPTFTAIAKNIAIKQLVIAFAEVWEEESQAISEREQAIQQAQNDPSIVGDDWRRLHHEHTDCIESRTRKKRILDYLAWHIENHQAAAFVELLFNHDSLPQVAEKIARFARRLDHKTSYDIAIRLKEEFAASVQRQRGGYYSSALGGYYYSTLVEGVGIGLIALASVCKNGSQKAILEVITNYIQTYDAEDFQDLEIFSQIVAGRLTDIKAAELVKQGKFMRRFWKNQKLTMYSQEVIAYLQAETLKVLFERCIKSEIDGAYWHITESPYILPAIAEKLPDEELSLIYEIGHARGESCGYYGYVRAATQCIDRMPEVVWLDTIQWALRGWASDSSLKQAIAPFVTPSMIPDRYLRTEISTSMAGYLPTETVQYIVRNFDKSYYGDAKGTEVLLQFVRYLPDTERLSILQKMGKEVFQIKDSGELNKALKALEGGVPLFARGHMRWLSRQVKTEMKNAYLLTSLKEDGYIGPVLESVFEMLPFGVRGGLGFYRYVSRILRAPYSLFRFLAKQIRLLRLNKLSHQAIQEYQKRFQKRTENPYSSLLDSWFGKSYYKATQILASSRLIWILYLLCVLVLAFILLPIFSVVAFLLLPFVVLIVGGQLLLIFLELGGDWLKDRFGRDKNGLGQHKNKKEALWELMGWTRFVGATLVGAQRGRVQDHAPTIQNPTKSQRTKKDKAYIWESVQNQVQVLNDLPDSQARRKAFVQIALTLGNVVRLNDSPDYKKYVAKAESIWSELRPEFVLDALSVLDNYDAYSTGFIESHHGLLVHLHSHKYVQAILPAVVFKDKSRLPDLVQHIEQPILTEIADYVTPDLIPYLLRWLSDYPAASALEKLAPKIVENNVWLAQGFDIAEKIDDSVHGFILNITPSVNKEWTVEAIVFVMERNLAEEQRKCMPVSVEHWLRLPPQEIYGVWQEVLKAMQGYSRPRMLTQLTLFSDVVAELAGREHVVDVVKEILAVWQWWDVVWQKPDKRQAKPL